MPFPNAKSHDPEHICCLCAKCHDLVTRGQLSKETVLKKYQETRSASPADVAPPSGPFDFVGPDATVRFGDLLYSPAIRRVLVYHGEVLLSVYPGYHGSHPARIRAVFTDEQGEPILVVRDNRWIGDSAAWDIDIEGKSLTVRSRATDRIALRLITQPPNELIIDRLDMRYGDAHVLVANGKYAAGRYVSETDVAWVHCRLEVVRASLLGSAIEFTTPETIEARLQALSVGAAVMAESTNTFFLHSNAGAIVRPIGISVGGLSGEYRFQSMASGVRSLKAMRRKIVAQPEDLDRFIARGEEPHATAK